MWTAVFVAAVAGIGWWWQAFVRRFDRCFHVPLPDAPARAAMLRGHLAGVETELSDDDLAGVALAADGYNGADLLSLSRQAAMAPVRESLAQTTMDCCDDTGYSGGTGDASDGGSSGQVTAVLAVRAVTREDYVLALQTVKATPVLPK